MKKAAVLLAVTAFLLAAAPAALATHKEGHGQPGKACTGSSGSAPSKNKHCQYPPGRQGASEAGKNATFEFPREADQGSFTLGMLMIAGLGAFTVLLGARGVVRRRLTG